MRIVDNGNKKAAVGALGALLLTIGLTTITPGPAQATTSCGSPVMVHSSAYNGYASYCPMWRGSVPVFGKNSAGYVDPNKVVGYLVYGGSSNWFVCRWTAGLTYAGRATVHRSLLTAGNGMFDAGAPSIGAYRSRRRS